MAVNQTYKSVKVTEKMLNRAKMFKSLPVSDWHQIIAFEKIIRNYIKLIKYKNEKD